MSIMSIQDEWAGPEWTIVRSDVDMAHVFVPNDTITFEAKSTGKYTVIHKSGPLVPDVFDSVVFVAVDGEQFSFDKVDSNYPLPLFSHQHARRYKKLADALETFAEKNKKVRRLEGTINIPCHGPCRSADHPTDTVETLIHVYQFADAVKGDDGRRRRLLVIRRPLDPASASNGNGIVLGYD
jgi:hypothetical protein